MKIISQEWLEMPAVAVGRNREERGAVFRMCAEVEDKLCYTQVYTHITDNPTENIRLRKSAEQQARMQLRKHESPKVLDGYS